MQPRQLSATRECRNYCLALDPASDNHSLQLVNLRIEGLTKTIYEGPILSRGTTITTPSGGTHHCDGTNFNANPTPGATCTTALDAASKLPLVGFSYDGTYSADFDDYFITSIGDSTQTSSQFWGLLLNYQFTPVGGCQQETKQGDHVLWAFDAFNKTYFLKLDGPIVAKKGMPITVTVTDGTTGAPIANAAVGDATTDASGKASITFSSTGIKTLKAERADSIRSNALVVVVA
jgi:hypothetical protein